MNELLTFNTTELTYFFTALIMSVVSAALYLKYFSKMLFRSYDFQKGFYLLGLALSLASSLALFNWQTTSPESYVVIETDIEDDRIEIPMTFREKPKLIVPPPPPTPIIKKPTEFEKVTLVNSQIEMADDPVLVDPVDVPEPPSSSEALPLPPPLPLPPAEEDTPEEWLGVSEQMPRFPGCELEEDPDQCTRDRLIDHIYKRLKYPELARENKVEGMVVVQFKIDKKGQMGEVVIRRDIGAGCGQAAADVVSSIKELSLWTPGKQRSRPVNILYTMPVKFKLN